MDTHINLFLHSSSLLLAGTQKTLNDECHTNKYILIYQGGFMVDLMAKDLGLAMETALTSQSSTPMGALARSLYAMHAASGNGGKDFSSIFNLFNK